MAQVSSHSQSGGVESVGVTQGDGELLLELDDGLLELDEDEELDGELLGLEEGGETEELDDDRLLELEAWLLALGEEDPEPEEEGGIKKNF